MFWALNTMQVLLMGPIGQGRKATVAALRECTYDGTAQSIYLIEDDIYAFLCQL